MSEERMMILRMLQEGKITAEEAARLLDAVGDGPKGPPKPPGLIDEIKEAAEHVVRAIPKESIDDVTDVIRETVREGREAARDLGEWGREARHWGRRWRGWGWHWQGTFGDRHAAVAPFEDVRTTTAAHLVFNNTRGDLRLSRSTDGQLHVRATRKVWAPEAGEAARIAERLPIDITEQGDTVTIEGPGARPFHERLRVDFDISLPDTLDVEAHVVRGDILAEGLPRDVSLSLVKGNVRVADCARVAVKGVSCDVDVQRSQGEVVVKVVRGDVKVAQSSGPIGVSAKRGDIAIRVDSAGTVAATTVRGDVVVRAREFAQGGGANLHAVRGDVAVYLGPAARCRIEASTVSGEVSSTLAMSESGRHRHGLSGVLNAPDAQLHVHTTRGDITLAPLDDLRAGGP